MSLLRIRELVRKEFLQLFRDKRNRPILIIAPIIQLLVFGYVVNYDIRDIRIALMVRRAQGKADLWRMPSAPTGSFESPIIRKMIRSWSNCFFRERSIWP